MNLKIAAIKVLQCFLFALLIQIGNINNLLATPYFQQTSDRITVSGAVADAQSGESLAGVNIIVEGTMVGVATNSHGEFTLNINATDNTSDFNYRLQNTGNCDF